MTDPGAQSPHRKDETAAMPRAHPGLTRREWMLGSGATLLLGAQHAFAGTATAEMVRPRAPLGPHRVREIETQWITLRDGVKIAARILLPEDAERHPVPAILEYIPYRRRDGTRVEDEHHLYYWASCGYACVRPDIRGSGDSEGVLKDEYLQSEQDDALEIIAWLARQRWCTGKVGMVGISWGGFSALQVAARQPPALKAIITHCSTDDRYTDDAHYLGGCLVQDMFGWGSDFYSLQAFPPDPAVVGERWREMWRARCEAIDFSVANWVTHQTRDAFWKHASVAEDYAAIRCPVYAIGGWADAYTNSIPRLMQNLTVPRKALIGPWGHTYPHEGQPGPAIDYLNEALRWWDHWLKGTQTGVMDEALYRVWMQDDAAHSGSEDVPGRWVAESAWPSARITEQVWHLGPGSLSREPPQTPGRLELAPHQAVGVTAGHWCPAGDGGEGELPVQLPLEQQVDDGRSLVFDSAPLDARLELLGAPELEIDVSVDQPVALIAVRLNAVHPGGLSRKLTYGVLNLTHRDGHEHPTALEPGRVYRLRIALKHLGCAILTGQRLRVSVSSAYWPLVWPTPEPVKLTVHTGSTRLRLPVRPPRAEDAQLRPLGQPFPLHDSGYTQLTPAARPAKTMSWDVGTGTLSIRSTFDGGVGRFDAIGTEVSSSWVEESRIQDADPTSAKLNYRQVHGFRRGDWDVRIETTIDVSCTATEYILRGEVHTFDQGKSFFSNSWERRIARQLS